MAGFTVFHRVRTGLIVGLIVGLFASAAVNLRPSTLAEYSEVPTGLFAWFERIEFFLLDLRMQLFAQNHPAEAPIAFVNVDDESLLGPSGRRHPWPWKRELLANLIMELDRLGARLILVEPEFISARAPQEEERAFASRVAPLNKVIFGFGFIELSPEPSPPLGRFAFPIDTYRTREEAIYAAAKLLSRPSDALFVLEAPDGFALWKGGFPSHEAALHAATQLPLPANGGQAEASPAPVKASAGTPKKNGVPKPPNIRELTTMEMFSRVTRELIFSTIAAMPHPDLVDFPSTFRSLRLLPLPLLTTGIHFGVSDLSPEFDGVIRRIRPVVRSEGRLYPSIALTAAQLLLDGEPISLTNTHLFVGSRTFALDKQGRLGLRFYGEPGKRHRANRPYPEISSFAIFKSAERRADGRITDRQVQELIEGKVVILSRTASGLHASTQTPVGESGSSFVWAMALEDMLRGSDVTRVDKPFDGWIAFAMAIAGGIVSALCLRLMRRWRTLFLNGSVSFFLLFGFTFYLEQAWAAGLWVAMFLPILSYAIACALTAFLLHADGMRLAGSIWDALGRSLPLQITERLLQNPSELSLKGARRDLTLWLLDLRQFSSWSAKLEPDVLVRLMNEIWTAISDEICHTRGQLDCVMGDAIFAYWGMPLPNRRHALDACRCALSVKALLKRRSKSWKQRYGVDIEGAMSLSGGELVVGDFGFKGERPRMNYTVLGTPLGQLKRLEAMSERWGNRILMTASLHDRIAGQVEARLIGSVRLSDQPDVEPVKVYELLALKGGLPRGERTRLAQFNVAQAEAAKRDFAKAIEILETLLKGDPDDLPSQVLLARCQQSLKTLPPEGWDGVFEVR